MYADRWGSRAGNLEGSEASVAGTVRSGLGACRGVRGGNIEIDCTSELGAIARRDETADGLIWPLKPTPKRFEKGAGTVHGATDIPAGDVNHVRPAHIHPIFLEGKGCTT